jgi:hypothetical protein
MSVPAPSSGSCIMMETLLAVCERELLEANKVANPICTDLPASEADPAGCKSQSPDSSVALFVSGVILGLLVILHGVRQAWYAWGGEGAYAFPFDK